MYIQKYENTFSFFEYRTSKAWDFFKCEFLELFFLSWNILMEFSLSHCFTWLVLINGLKIIRGKEGSRQPNQLIFFSLGNKLLKFSHMLNLNLITKFSFARESVATCDLFLLWISAAK